MEQRINTTNTTKLPWRIQHYTIVDDAGNKVCEFDPINNPGWNYQAEMICEMINNVNNILNALSEMNKDL